MKKEYSLRSENNFKLLFTKGRRLDTRLFRIVARRNNLAHSRFAFVASRSIEKRAVLRNQAKRRAKEWVWRHQEFFPVAVDVALVFKKEAIVSPKKTFYEELRKTFAQSQGS